jgi:hypothetical protein
MSSPSIGKRRCVDGSEPLVPEVRLTPDAPDEGDAADAADDGGELDRAAVGGGTRGAEIAAAALGLSKGRTSSVPTVTGFGGPYVRSHPSRATPATKAANSPRGAAPRNRLLLI